MNNPVREPSVCLVGSMIPADGCRAEQKPNNMYARKPKHIAWTLILSRTETGFSVPRRKMQVSGLSCPRSSLMAATRSHMCEGHQQRNTRKTDRHIGCSRLRPMTRSFIHRRKVEFCAPAKMNGVQDPKRAEGCHPSQNDVGDLAGPCPPNQDLLERERDGSLARPLPQKCGLQNIARSVHQKGGREKNGTPNVPRTIDQRSRFTFCFHRDVLRFRLEVPAKQTGHLTSNILSDWLKWPCFSATGRTEGRKP